MQIRRHLKVLRSIVCFVALTSCFWLFNVSLCHGQQIEATVYGAVTDPAGLPIPDATVTVTNPGTGQSVVAKTGADGSYIVPSLRASTYDITVEHNGFQVSIQKGIKLDVNQQARIDVRLKVGAVTTTVEVAGVAPQVETATATVGMMIDTKQVTELPLNIRRFGTLPLLMPGTIADRGGFTNSVLGSPFSENTYAANGARGSGNNTLIDGIDSKNLFTGGFSVQPSPDAVQEFKVQTESFSAVFGKSSGSTINLVTKSGTNELHGSAFEFLRNSKLDSRNFFDINQTDLNGNEIPGTARGQLQRNQFGGYIGGPIKKNKTFFFGGYEGLRLRKGNNVVDQVPTTQMLQGDFSQLYTGQTFSPCASGGPSWDTGQIFDPATIHALTCGDGSTVSVANAFTGNIISPTQFDPVAKKVIATNAWPTPNVPGAIYSNWVGNPVDKRRDNQFLIKIDHELNEKNKFFGRYIFAQSIYATPAAGYSSLPGYGDTIRFRGQNLALSWTHTFSPNILNELRLGFSRNMDKDNCTACPRAAGFVESFGVPGLTALSPGLEGFPAFEFGQGYSTVGDSNYRPVESNDMVEKYNETLTIIKGKHTLAFGTDIQPYQSLRNQAPVSPHGQLNYGGQYSNSSIADFLLGDLNGYGRSYSAATNNHDGKFWNFFFQEDWRASKKLTVNAGVRWEYHQLPTDRRNVGAILFPIPGAGLEHPGNALMMLASYARADQYCNNPFYTNAEGQKLIACSADMKKYGFTDRAERSLWFPDRNNWAPRLGFAYRPTNSDRIVLRAGYGMFFDLSEFNVFHYGFNNPIDGASVLNSGLSVADVPSGQFLPPAATTSNAFVGVTLPTLANSFMSMNVDPHFKQPYVHEYDFEIESQLTQDMALSVRYLGTDAFQMSHFHFFGNQPVPGPGDPQARRLYPDFGMSAITGSEASGNYNSLQAQLTKKMTHGFNFTVGYTYSKSLSNNEGEEGAYTDAATGQNDNNPGGEYARDINDARQRLTFSTVTELPFGRGRRFASDMGRFPNAFLGGWEISGIFSAQAGFPETVTDGLTIANVTGANPERPDRVCDGNISNHTINHWFNQNCFTTAFMEADASNGIYRFGNSSRSVITGPGSTNIDFGLMKNFQVNERWRAQFRAEFFNAFNHANFGDPHMNMQDGSYDTITGAGQPRDIQFALKFTF